MKCTFVAQMCKNAFAPGPRWESLCTVLSGTLAKFWGTGGRKGVEKKIEKKGEEGRREVRGVRRRGTGWCDLGEGCFLALREKDVPVSQWRCELKSKDRQLEFSYRQLQISDGGGYGCSKFQLCP